MGKMYNFLPDVEFIPNLPKKDFLRIICPLHDISCFFAVFWLPTEKQTEFFGSAAVSDTDFCYLQTGFLFL